MRWPWGVVAVVLAGSSAGLSFAPPSATLVEIQQMIESGDLAHARIQLTQLLQQAPNDAVALNLMGVVDGEEGRFEDAKACYNRAVAAEPSFAGAYLNLGRLYQENEGSEPDALKKSLATYDSALKFEPSNAEANYQSAFLLWRLGSFRPSLNRLNRLGPDARQRPQALALTCADDAATHGDLTSCDALLQHLDHAATRGPTAVQPCCQAAHRPRPSRLGITPKPASTGAAV